MNPELPMVLMPLAIIAFMAIYLRSKRGQPLPPAAPVAEETHASPLLGGLLVVAAAGPWLAVASVPGGVPRIFGGLICILLLVSAMAAWSGFRYTFTASGLEISTLGFRLRSIPAEQIEKYEIKAWSLLRGYGIRGVGKCRAYVWGNKVVHIRTTQGELFISHSEPEKVVHDLDMVTHSRGQEAGSLL